MQKQTKKPAPTRRKAHRKTSRYSKAVLRWLIFCFPAGLLMMWSDRCRWPRATKSLVSALIACLIGALVIPQTLPPERTKGGVELVSLAPAVEVQGPRQQEGDAGLYEVHVSSYIKPTSIIVEPTPTPIPTYVYCNAGGRHYHVKSCRYVKNTSDYVPMGQALDAGFTPCKDCKAPREEDVQ